jgi:hypothetical protein
MSGADPSTSTVPRAIVAVLDGPPVPAWQACAVAELERRGVPLAEVRLAGARRRGMLRRAHAAIERHLFAPGPDALAPASPGEPRLGPRPAHSEPELLLWLAERAAPSGEPRDVLCLRHGRRREPAEDAFRRAALRGLPTVESELLLRREGRTTLVERTVSAVRPYSTTLSRDKALWKLAVMVARAVERMPGLGESVAPCAPATAPPSTAELLLRSPRRWLRVVAARVLFVRPWQISVRERGPEPTAGWHARPGQVSWQRGHLYADPFLFEHEGRHHLFCEEIAPGSRRAVISHTELGGDRVPARAPAPVLEASYHLSYPFVFAHQGALFMIPETSAQQRVELYRAVEFPHRWVREGVLLEGLAASDATVLCEDGLLWMFVGVAAPHAMMLDELHLFTASTPLGPWLPHPANPVVSDVRCGRPAGAIQRWGARLVRPAQDGSLRYGGAVSFREIDVLSRERYAEHEIARIDPGDLGGAARATHTYAADNRYEAVDLREREPRPRSLLAGFARRCRRR